MPYVLKNKNVLVTGGSRGIGRVVCEKFAQEQSNVAINYLNSAEKAQELADRLEQEYGIRAVIVQGNAGTEEGCQKIIKGTISALGGLDVLISNAGYTRFSNFDDIYATTEEDWDTCYAVNVKSQLWLMREAAPTLKANPQGGVFIMTSSIAGLYPQGSSMPYSVTKAAQMHMMRCLAKTQAPEIRVNAVLPGLVLTEWGNKYTPEAIEEMKQRAWLKADTNIEDLAQAFVDTARNTSMTGQKVQIDSGLWNV